MIDADVYRKSAIQKCGAAPNRSRNEPPRLGELLIVDMFGPHAVPSPVDGSTCQMEHVEAVSSAGQVLSGRLPRRRANRMLPRSGRRPRIRVCALEPLPRFSAIGVLGFANEQLKALLVNTLVAQGKLRSASNSKTYACNEEREMQPTAYRHSPNQELVGQGLANLVVTADRIGRK